MLIAQLSALKLDLYLKDLTKLRYLHQLDVSNMFLLRILTRALLIEFDSLKVTFDHAFHIKNLGDLRLNVAHSSCHISLCQQKYCLELLANSSVTDCKLVITLLDPTIRLH
ncbi:hypothetical protein CR513_50632, partial [Mucuna pruriens]